MATDYIVFIHGVNTRDKQEFTQTAKQMFADIKSKIAVKPGREIKPVILFWGNIAKTSIDPLVAELRQSPKWDKFWFREFREKQVINFVGDAALYLSRNVSVDIIEQMTAQAIEQMGLSGVEDIRNNRNNLADDRLHLVTHSWGTVILFDIIFADRWESNELDENIREKVKNIRTAFFGVGKSEIKNYGVPIASIHTMGSPISLFNLLNSSGARSFNLTPNLKEFLTALYARNGNKVLPWSNYAHPGDPIAYPLKGVLDLSLDEAKDKVEIEDNVLPANSIPFLSQNVISIIWGGDAHNSYWGSRETIDNIGRVISNT